METSVTVKIQIIKIQNASLDKYFATCIYKIKISFIKFMSMQNFVPITQIWICLPKVLMHWSVETWEYQKMFSIFFHLRSNVRILIKIYQNRLGPAILWELFLRTTFGLKQHSVHTLERYQVPSGFQETELEQKSETMRDGERSCRDGNTSDVCKRSAPSNLHPGHPPNTLCDRLARPSAKRLTN